MVKRGLASEDHRIEDASSRDPWKRPGGAREGGDEGRAGGTDIASQLKPDPGFVGLLGSPHGLRQPCCRFPEPACWREPPWSFDASLICGLVVVRRLGAERNPLSSQKGCGRKAAEAAAVQSRCCCPGPVR
jgi:hypothetical protein